MSSSPSTKVACVWGANGLSGMGMIDVLTEQTRDEFSKIICISRRKMQTDMDDDRICFISIDIFEASIDEIVAELIKANGQTITHMFHYAYIQKMDENEKNDANKILLQKALDATEKVAGTNVKCVSLQTGYKVRKHNVHFSQTQSIPVTSIMACTKEANTWLPSHLLKKHLVMKARTSITLKKILSKSTLKKQLEVYLHSSESYHWRF